MRYRTAVTVALVVLALALAAPAGLAAVGAADEHEYDGQYVGFDVEANGIAEYTVDGETLFESVAVESASEAGIDAGAEADAQAATDLVGSALDVRATTEAEARFRSEGGAELVAHDNERGHLTVHAAEERTLVELETSYPAGTSTEGSVVIVGGAEQVASVFVVGEGEVAETEDGNVVADLHEGDRLVFRSNGEERDDEDQATERMIEIGESAGEVYVHERNGDTVADTVEYSDDFAVDVAQRSEGYLELGVEREAEAGTVVVMEVAESLIERPDEAEVRVSGETATHVETFADVHQTLGDGEHHYTTGAATTSEANAALLVAVDSFSRQTIEVEETEDVSEDGIPGFGVTVALAALLATALAARRVQ